MLKVSAILLPDWIYCSGGFVVLTVDSSLAALISQLPTHHILIIDITSSITEQPEALHS